VLELRRKDYSVESKHLPNIVTGETRLRTLPKKKPHPKVTGIEIRKILAPTDLSSTSRAGVRYALNAAKAFDAEVLIYHVVTVADIVAFGRSRKKGDRVAAHFHSLIETSDMRLQDFIKHNFGADLGSVKLKRKVEMGTPKRNIVETAKSAGIDLIVLASSGKGRLARMLFGSVTEEVLRGVTCPVMTIPSEFAITLHDDLDKVA